MSQARDFGNDITSQEPRQMESSKDDSRRQLLNQTLPQQSPGPKTQQELGGISPNPQTQSPNQPQNPQLQQNNTFSPQQQNPKPNPVNTNSKPFTTSSQPVAKLPPRQVVVNQATASILKDPAVWKSFPFGQGLFLKMKRCFSKEITFVDHIKSYGTGLNNDDVRRMAGQIFKIHIQETSQLELDPNVLHPFVRVHVIDMTTGKYLQKRVAMKDVVSVGETKTNVKADPIVPQNLDYIPPFSCNCCDLREAGNARARFNHSIYLNEEATEFFSANTVVLFELLDYNIQMLTDNSKQLDHENFYRIAWGYLKLSGLAKTHLGYSKVQLFKYKFKPSLTQYKIIQDRFPSVPSVFYDFLWPKKLNYDGYITVSCNALPQPGSPFPSEQIPMSVFDFERDNIGVALGMHGKKDRDLDDKIEDDPESLRKQRELLKMKMFPGDDCNIPSELLHRFQTTELGCFRLCFSPNGRYLAAACTYKTSKTVIKIFNVEDGVLRYTIRAHKNIIHDMEFHPYDNRILISSSSDFSAKIWKLMEKEPNDEIEEEDSERLLTHCPPFEHPSYVYSAKFFKERDSQRLITATACFDGKVRIWRADFDEGRYVKHGFQDHIVSQDEHVHDFFDNLLEHRHPNSLQFDQDGFLYIGDSIGSIHVWIVRASFNGITVNRQRVIESKEMAGDPINSINISFDHKRQIIAHSRDNCIRIVDFSDSNKNRIMDRFFGSKSTKMPIRSVSSPDSQYILSGSEDGKPYLWDIMTGDREPLDHLGVNFIGPVTDVAWNPEYHMIACSGFGEQYPILVFCHKEDQTEEINKQFEKMKAMEKEQKEQHQYMPEYEKNKDLSQNVSQYQPGGTNTGFIGRSFG